MAAQKIDRARGTGWRIWDLHVHTPASLVQSYGKNSDEVWERFITELESLPEDLTVIGINDYWFLDGYKRIIAAKQSGRLENIETIFPVIEMRLDHFGGTTGSLSRVNLHVIFDSDLDPGVIQAQFINALQPSARLSPGNAGIQWNGTITRESLTDLGNQIKQTVPPDQIDRYGSDLIEGFNNLNVSLSEIQALLERAYFKGRSLVGIGKTEWRNIKWNDQSIAAKKTVINSADFVFTAFEDTSKWQSDVAELKTSGVTHRLLDCSDAHFFSDSNENMRLGACQTWINSTPTLAGLSYALEEFDRRVYVGLEPPELSRVRKNPEWFIDRIRVGSDAEEHELFSHDLPLNPGFVAVVGNKGQGKSSLLDCIALAGNSSRNSEFAFLNPKRFLNSSSQRLAKNYISEITWASGNSRSSVLSESHDRSAPITIEYLPQMFVERVCNLDPDIDDADEFERELRTVLFTHIPEQDRSGETTFDSLLSQKTRTSQDSLRWLRDELRNIIREYVVITTFRSENSVEDVTGRLRVREAEVKSARDAVSDASKALIEIDLQGSSNGELTKLRNDSKEINEARTALIGQIDANEKSQAQVRQKLNAMEVVLHSAEAIGTDILQLNRQAEQHLGGDSVDFISFSIDTARYQTWVTQKTSELTSLEAGNVSLNKSLQEQEKIRKKNAELLAVADGSRERARQRVLQSEERVADLVGREDDIQSLEGLEGLLKRLKDSPAELDAVSRRLVEKSSEIHHALGSQLQTVSALYKPASDFISHSDVVKNAGLEFNAELRILPDWRGVPAGLDGRRNGDFSEWLMEMPQRIEDTSWEQLGPQLSIALDRLCRERAELDGAARDPKSALRAATSLEDFLMATFDLSWLDVRFGLTGDGLPLSQLSPGQRGLVLALFYLVVDRRTTPLLLDQPEENLDNATIASKLVPAIHEAAGRRQTIVVTHNANLAIVGDADQVIHCKRVGSNFRVNSGSIAELNVARFALDVLEGTKPAFDNRRYKYEAFPSLV